MDFLSIFLTCIFVIGHVKGEEEGKEDTLIRTKRFAASAYKIRARDKEKCVEHFKEHTYQKELFEGENKTRTDDAITVAVYFIPENGAGFVCGYKAGQPCFPKDEEEIHHFMEQIQKITKTSFNDTDAEQKKEKEELITRVRHEFCASSYCDIKSHGAESNATEKVADNSTGTTSNETAHENAGSFPVCGSKCLRGLTCKEVPTANPTIVYENGNDPSTSSAVLKQKPLGIIGIIIWLCITMVLVYFYHYTWSK